MLFIFSLEYMEYKCTNSCLNPGNFSKEGVRGIIVNAGGGGDPMPIFSSFTM